MFKRSVFTALVVIVLVLAGCATEPKGTAPGFTLQSLNGETVSLNQFQGQAVVINFWQLSCPPCIEELPHFQAVHNSANETIILTIAIRNSAADLDTFMSQNGYTFPVLLDVNADVAASYGLRFTPTTFLIDKEGEIIDLQVGAFASQAELERALSKLD
ncbi:TlpA disulfide reductase family protein [Dehalogenimonas sp. THU2]|uniref:TlpA family protein disulfide reductase n=1 Tax=Dehalogenimonas sp. THU2 TaxID=3151121 RepID=UPI003218C5AC